jgi:putative MATE family efflux protein
MTFAPSRTVRRVGGLKACSLMLLSISWSIQVQHASGFVTSLDSRCACRVSSHPARVPDPFYQDCQQQRRSPIAIDPLSRNSRRLTSLSTTSATALSSDADKEEEDNNGKRINYDWTSQNVKLAIPALVGMLADPLLSLMDTAYVGRVGATELAALGACTSIFHLAFNAFRATTTATTSLVGNAESEDERRQIIKISLSLGIVLGVIVMTILEVTGPWCLATMGVPGTSPLFKPANSYLRTRLWAAPAVLAIVVSEGAFRGYGDTKIPLLASLVASFINLILDPIFMFPLGMGVAGAAAATGVAQLGAVAVYFSFLLKRKMLPKRGAKSKVVTSKIVKTILGANLAMVCKQGSLLLGWAYATARATRIGSAHVAAHQVALSCWLVFALVLDGAGVSAQVLMSRSMGDYKKVRSLVIYMLRHAVLQGLATTGLILAAAPYLPNMFTPDPVIGMHLHSLMPQLAWQQLLVSLTLVSESLAIGGNQFKLLAVGTTISTVLAIWQLRYATNVVTIWSKGIVTLFMGRLITALIGTLRVLHVQRKLAKQSESSS